MHKLTANPLIMNMRIKKYWLYRRKSNTFFLRLSSRKCNLSFIINYKYFYIRLRAELEESKRKAVKELENAKKEVEMQLGSQKTSYEREIKMLGMTLEQQRLALEEVNKKKRQLEVEKEMLTYQIQENKTREVKSMLNVEPYESNFLQELEKILNEATADAEIALTIAASNEVIAEGGITLHEMQLLVREATQRCRDIGINYVSIL